MRPQQDVGQDGHRPSPAPRPREAVSAWDFLRRGVGATLVAAAVLKGHALATLPPSGTGLLSQRWLAAASVEMEAVWGAWLILGGRGRGSRMATLALWLAFACISGYEAASGAETCGCFGRVGANPRYTLAFDVGVAAAVALCRTRVPAPGPLPPCKRRRTIAGVACVALAGAIFCGWAASGAASGPPSQEGLTFSEGTIILEPAKWVGRPFVLNSYIDVGHKLTVGHWLVLLYRMDCEHCRRAVPRYLALAKRAARVPAMPSVALIEMPPFGDGEQDPNLDDSGATWGRLSGDHDWFASTPVAVILRDGRVAAVAEGSDAEFPILKVPPDAGTGSARRTN